MPTISRLSAGLCDFVLSWSKVAKYLGVEDNLMSGFSDNLRLLCSFERSVSEVCRRIGINRQQFNKYLNGTSTPSAYNLRLISEYFGVKSATLMLSHAEFCAGLAADAPRSSAESRRSDPVLAMIDRAVPRGQHELRKYLGFYHSHFYSLSWRGYIIRSLINIYENGGRVFSRGIERLRDPTTGERYVFKYDGVVGLHANRIFVVEFESLTHAAIANTILCPAYRSHVAMLPGLTMGASSRTSRDPAASRVVYQYLGKTVDYRVALRACGAFLPSSREVDPRIMQAIANTIEEGETAFIARH